MRTFGDFPKIVPRHQRIAPLSNRSGVITVTVEIQAIFQLRLSADHGLSLNLFNQHLSMMLHDVLTPTQRRVFQELWSRPAVEEFLENVLMINEIE